MPAVKKPSAAAKAAGQPSPHGPEHDVQTLRRVLEHVRGHSGKLPSQTKDVEKKLYFQYRKVRGKTEEQLGPAGSELMKQIHTAMGRPGIDETQALATRLQAHGGSCGDNASPGARIARKTRQKLLSPTADLTPRRGALVRTLAKKDNDLPTCHDCWNIVWPTRGACRATRGTGPLTSVISGRSWRACRTEHRSAPPR